MKDIREMAYEFVCGKFENLNDLKSAMDFSDNLKKLSPKEVSEQAGNTFYDEGRFWREVMNAVNYTLWYKFYQF